VITKGTLLTDPEDLLGDAVTEETDYFLWKGGHFVKYNSQEIVKGETLTFAAEQEWGTYFTDASDLALPEGMTAYYVSGVSLDANGETGTMTLASTGTKLYKNVPTLIQRASTTQALEAVAEQATYTDGETIRGAMHGYFHGTAVGETFQQQAANMNTFFVLRDGAFIKAKDRHCGDDILFSDKAGDRGDRILPAIRAISPTAFKAAKRIEEEFKSLSKGTKDGPFHVIGKLHLAFFVHDFNEVWVDISAEAECCIMQ
jgi:hypothetical protein